MKISDESRQILKDAGYPPDILVIDFETYFTTAYSLRKISTAEYINNPEFEVLGVGLIWDYEDEGKRYVEEEFYCGASVRDRILSLGTLDEFTVVAHNAKFDLSILEWYYKIRPTYSIDLLGLCRHWETRTKNGIGDLVKRYGIGEKGDTGQFKNQTYRVRSDGVLVNEEELEKYTRDDVRHEHELFDIMLPKLTNPKFELEVMKHTMDLYTQPVITVDYELAAELKADMEAEITKACEAARITPKEARSTKQFAHLLDCFLTWAGDDPDMYKKQGKKGPMFALAKADPELELLKQHEDQAVRDLIGARVACKSWPLHIARIDRIVAQAKACGDRLPVPLSYHGAHTGRYSGG
jgi:hypothetical protein